MQEEITQLEMCTINSIIFIISIMTIICNINMCTEFNFFALSLQFLIALGFPQANVTKFIVNYCFPIVIAAREMPYRKQ